MRGPRTCAIWLALGLALGGCWTGSAPPPVPAGEAAARPRVVRVPRVRARGLARRPPPRLTRAQRQFPPELRAVRADAIGCVKRHGAAATQTLWLEVSIDAYGAVTAARAAGFGAAEPCVLRALRSRRFADHTDTTISLTIPRPGAHPPP